MHKEPFSSDFVFLLQSKTIGISLIVDTKMTLEICVDGCLYCMSLFDPAD